MIAALLLSGCSAADSYLVEKQAKEAVAKLLIDPSSADFRNVAVRGGHVCGEVNAKNRTGAYVGFKRFLVDRSGWTARIDPEMDYGDLLSARDLCSSMSGNSYSSYSSTRSACDRAAELEAQNLEQQSFNAAWKANCAGNARLPFEPVLGPAEETTEAPANNVLATAPDNAADPDTSADMNVDAELQPASDANAEMNADPNDEGE